MTALVALPASRGAIDRLVSPKPLAVELPALLQQDEFCLRLMDAFDEVLAPVFATLDSLASYLDPALAPNDFVDYLAGWVGVEVDETWSIARRRRFVWEAVGLYRMRGTAEGLVAHLQLYAGATPDIVESGGCGWSQTSDTVLPGSSDPHLTVRLQVADPEAINPLTVDRIVAASHPAHIPYSVEVRAATGDLVSAAVPGGPAAPAADATGAVALPGSERIQLAAPGQETGLTRPGAGYEEPTT